MTNWILIYDFFRGFHTNIQYIMEILRLKFGYATDDIKYLRGMPGTGNTKTKIKLDDKRA